MLPVGAQRDEPRAHDLVGDGRAQEAERRADAGTHGDDDLLHAELARQAGGMERRRAAKGDQCTLGGVLAVFDGMHAGGTRHGLVDDFRDACRRALRVGFQRVSQGLQGSLCLLRIERQRAPSEAGGIEPTEGGVRVGHGGFGTAIAVAGRARDTAGRIGADLDAAQRIEPRDRAATGADLDQFDHRNAHGQAAALHEAIGARDFELARALQLEIVEQGELGRGASHVEGDGLGDGIFGRDRERQDGAAGRARFDQPHRIAPRRVDRGDAA